MNNDLINKVMNFIYSGAIIRLGLNITYIICAIASFGLPIAGIYYLSDAGQFMRGTSQFVFYIFGFLAVIVLLAEAILCLKLWIDRRKKLDGLFNETHNNRALAMLAEVVRTFGEWNAMLFYSLVAPVAIAGVGLILSMALGDFFTFNMFIDMVSTIVASCVCLFIAGVFTHLTSRAVAEFIRSYAKISDDVADMADITRTQSGI